MQLRLRCYPPTDERFGRLAESLIRDVDPGPDGEVTDLVAARLREAYPDAVIVPRSPLAALDRRDVVWYVYRDGHPLVRPRPGPGACYAPDRLELALRRAVALSATAARQLRIASRWQEAVTGSRLQDATD